jgi:hypothetical protein
MPTHGWRNLRASLSAFQAAGKTRPCWKVLRPVRRLKSPTEITELPERTRRIMLWPGQTHRRPQ